MLDIRALTCLVGGNPIFDQASVQIGANRRIGVVGRNGAGKSTLLRLIAGDLQPDGGRISISSRTRVGFVEQFAPAGDAALIDIVLAADKERAALLEEAERAHDPGRIADIHTRLTDIGAHSAPARAATILAGLGFDHAAQQRPVDAFSGGWRMRVALAAGLFSAPDLLLLDEPTNHLDLEASLWLERFLAAYPHTFLMVSHDRALLDRSVDGILHVDAGKLALYPGGFETFARTREERRARDLAVRKRQERERRHIQAFVDRFRAKASKARQAQSRLKLLERMEPVAPLQDEASIRFRFPAPAELRPPIVTLDGAAAGYDAGTPILQRLDLRIDMDDRIGLLGQNGNGKSTLLRLLASQLECMSGTMSRSGKLRVGYFAQDQLEQLTPTVSAYAYISSLLPDRPEPAVRAHLGGFGFAQEKADLSIASLSGGERARLVLAGICCDAPQLLLLDEPTNHLDIDAREALLEALNDFPGAVILVTHDHHLLARAVDRLWLVADGTCTPYPEDLDHYRQSVQEQRQATASASGGGAPDDKKRPSKQAQRRSRAEARAAVAPLRKTVREAEALLRRLTKERQEIEAILADPKLYADKPEEVASLNRRRVETERRISDTEDTWLAAQTALEAQLDQNG
ncbi:MAG: ATP-binding cassette domain-containing protein [Alphaproteobacteria bacterium]|nr:ATP-binding cassette domain-containing protein [Alphaproteobacteria bacterium]